MCLKKDVRVHLRTYRYTPLMSPKKCQIPPSLKFLGTPMQSEVIEDCKCSYLHVPVEEAVFVHERQPLQHLVHDVADDRLGEHSVPAADGEASSGHP